MSDAYAPSLDLVTEAIKQLGHERINPESLMALIEYVADNGWHSFSGINGDELHRAHRMVMAGFRALFAPV